MEIVSQRSSFAISTGKAFRTRHGKVETLTRYGVLPQTVD
jgi:hypothetical protein